MALYRMAAGDGVAWVTGASTGIGRGLALALARDGHIVAVSARSSDKLALLAAEAHGLKGRILSYPCDATDREAMDKTIETIEQEAGPITLAVLNAGIHLPSDGDTFDIENFVKTYELNVFGVLHGLVPVVRRMHALGRGHIVITGSASAYLGLPSAAAYGSSKAALNYLAEALKYDFDKMNIRIQMLNPSFIDTPMTENNTKPMPGLLSVDAAIALVLSGMRDGGFDISFPRRMVWPLKFVRMLPQQLRFPIVNRATGWNTKRVKPPKP